MMADKAFKVSVVVPCFNSEKTICRCIDSLLSQTINLQIIIVNDGSKDSTLQIVNDYALRHSNVKVISHENRGLPQSRKVGMQQAETKYVAFVDSDDWVEADMFEKLFYLAEEYKSEITTCGLFYDTEKKSKVSKGVAEKMCVDGLEALSLLHKREAVYPFMCNKMFLTKFLKNKDFPTGNFLGEDYATIVPCLADAEKVVVANEPLYHYIIKEGSMSKSGYSAAYRKAFDNYKTMYEIYKTNRNVFGEKKEMAAYLCVEFSAIYVAMIRNSNYDNDAIEYIRRFLKTYLKVVLKGSVGLHFKVSVVFIAIAPRLFKNIYGLLTKFN